MQVRVGPRQSHVNKGGDAQRQLLGSCPESSLWIGNVAVPGLWTPITPIIYVMLSCATVRRSERAREAYEALPTPAKRSVLYSLYSAKREDTRAKRLAKTLAALGSGASLR